jgi:hypothetical protein
MLRIESWIESYLSRFAEYRMGVHKVIATLSSGTAEEGIIVNSTVFLKEDEIPWQMEYGWEYFTKEASKSQLVVTKVQVIPRDPDSLRGVKHIALANEKNRRLANRALKAADAAFGTRRDQLLSESRLYEFSAKSAAAEDAPITLTVAEEVFKRFSAFVNDRRITQGKGLLAERLPRQKKMLMQM